MTERTISSSTESGRLGMPAEEAVGRLTRLAVRLLGAEAALITTVDALPPEPGPSDPALPLADLLARRVVAARAPLAVEDARRHPLTRHHPAVRHESWLAYAGVPVRARTGEVLGAFAVVDAMPRLWSDRDVLLLEDVAASLATEIELQRALGGATGAGSEEPDLFAAAGVGLAVVSADGRWIRVNRAFADLLGYEPELLIGCPAEALTHPDDLAAEREANRLLLAGECPSYQIEKRLLGRSGETVSVLATIALVRRGGLPDRLLVGLQELAGRQPAAPGPAERYRLAVRAAGGAVWDWDLVTDRRTWDEELEPLFGHPWPLDEPTGAWWYERVHAEDRERVVAAIHAAVGRGEGTWAVEYRFRRGDGSYAHVVDRGIVVRDPAGTPSRLAGLLIDVSGARRSDALANGESHLLEQIARGVDLAEVMTGILRFAEEHTPGARCSIVLPEEGGGELRFVTEGDGAEGYRPVLEVPIIASGGSLGTLVVRAPDADPSVRVERRTIDLAARLAGIAIDRERSQTALSHSTRLLQEVLETLPVGVWVLSQRGELVFGNPAARQIWGGERRVALDRLDEYRGWWAETGEPIRSEEWAPARAIRRGETALNEVVHIEGFDGGHRTILNSAVPIRDAAGAILGAIWVNQDITERKAAEEALRRSEEQLRQAQKMEAVGQLAGGIAHDFNNLLTGILSYCELILQQLRQGDPIRADVEQIRQAGQRAAGLTRQLLAFSRRQVLQPRVLSLNATVTELDAMLRRLLGADVELETDLDPGLWYVLADPGQLEQVLVNLIVNARDAMPTGGRVTIATSNLRLDPAATARPDGARPGEYVALMVSDTGIGMDVATQARVFEPFFTTKEPGKGTGLGLSTVYGIVEQSGGHIVVDSAPGRGATFTVYLPRFTGSPAGVPATGDRRSLPGGTETLLLVEDEVAVRTSVRRLLERHGYTVLEARHGADALRIFDANESRIELVLTDVVMPEMGGRELVERLRVRRPGLRVLFMSGYTEKAITPDGTMPPGTGFVEKPFTVEALMRRLREVLDADR